MIHYLFFVLLLQLLFFFFTPFLNRQFLHRKKKTNQVPPPFPPILSTSPPLTLPSPFPHSPLLPSLPSPSLFLSLFSFSTDRQQLGHGRWIIPLPLLAVDLRNILRCLRLKSNFFFFCYVKTIEEYIFSFFIVLSYFSVSFSLFFF